MGEEGSEFERCRLGEQVRRALVRSFREAGASAARITRNGTSPPSARKGPLRITSFSSFCLDRFLAVSPCAWNSVTLLFRLSLRRWQVTRRYPIFRSRRTQTVGRQREPSTGDTGQVFAHPSNENTHTCAFRRFLDGTPEVEHVKSTKERRRAIRWKRHCGCVDTRLLGIMGDKNYILIDHCVSRVTDENGHEPTTLAAPAEPKRIRPGKRKHRARFLWSVLFSRTRPPSSLSLNKRAQKGRKN